MTDDIDEGEKAEEWSRVVPQLHAIQNVLPAYAWYGTRSGSLTFVNKRQADALDLETEPAKWRLLRRFT